MMTPKDRAVMKLSAYNTLSLTGQDMTTDQIVAFLSSHWDPAKSRNAKRASRATIETACNELTRDGYVSRDGDVFRILARDPMTRRGETLNIDYRRAALVRESDLC